MGVPSFYRWLVGKYPKTVLQAIDEGDDCDCNNQNPNGEFDNFYLDMNGIVHPCFHPDSEIFAPTTFNEVFIAIFEYIDHLFRIVRPRKLLFVAIDGVAPRAKMNQQRARRYRTAKDVELSKIEEEKLRKEFERQGKELLPMQENSELSDSNVITPGTVFMQKLSTALEYYIRLKLNRDPSWKSIMVILSDSNVPGEGEHKIMSFIRLQRSLPGYDSNTRHCIYGLDADLIMLALATHEIHFSVLREDVLKQSQEIDIAGFVSNSSQQELDSFKTKQWFKQIEASNHKKAHKKPYQFLNVWILREYLELDMKPESESVDIERIVDDFIFICFFSGNDFLPHLPSIEIHEGAIDLLIAVYKKMFKTMGGYLADTSRMDEEKFKYIDFQRVKLFIIKVGSYEDKIFRKRCDLRKKKLQRLLQEREKEGNDRINSINSEFNAMQEDVTCNIAVSEQTTYSFSQKCCISSSLSVEANGSTQSDALTNTKELVGILKQFLRDKSDLFKNEVFNNDKVKLDCPGWKDRYYKEKLLAENAKELEAIRTVLVEKYVQGLCWVLKYYFTGVCSWSWYYPFYYAPFASDLKDLCCPKVSFTVGKPFKPFNQLMSVLPPRSSHALPKAYRSLMNNDDSPIRNFYPEDFVVDNDGIRFTWQGVCKLPFIEEELLLGATKILCEELEDDEVERNLIKSAKVFVLDSNSLFTQINPPIETQIHDVVGASCELNCFLTLIKGGSNPSTIISPVLGMEDISNDRSSCADFVSKEPEIHITRILTDNMPEKTIEHSDIVQRILWHKYPGHFPPPIQPQRVPKTLYPPENEARKPPGLGCAGRGKVLYDAFRAGPCTDRRPSPAFSAPNANWKAKVNNLSTNYGRGQLSTVSSVSASTLYNKFQVLEEGDDFWPRAAPMVDNIGRGGRTPTLDNYGNRSRGRGHQNVQWGQYNTASSVSSSTTCGKFQVMDNSSGNFRHRSTPLVDNRGRTMNGNQGRGRGHQNVQWVRKPENVDKL